MPAMDVVTAGRMTVLADPEGAVLSLWQAGDHAGAEVFNEHGALPGNELGTGDCAGARGFYGDALGWEFERLEGESSPGEYWLIRIEGKTADGPYTDDPYNGGVLTMEENWPPDVPPHWMVYFPVDDADLLVERPTDLAGTVSVPPLGTLVGWLAVVGDPQGGKFSVIAPPAES